jgi:hypothetical protein
VLAGCAGELENPERFAECPPGFVEQVLQQRCGNCHSGGAPEAALDLAAPDVGTRVMGVVSSSMLCSGRVLVDPAGVDHLLIEKIEDQPSCGGRMPFGLPALPPTEVECVRRWVDDMVSAGGS